MIEPLPGYGEVAGGEARRSVTRSAIIFTPMFLLSFAAFAATVAAVATGNGGNLIILLIITALLALLLGFQAIGALLDVRASLRETSGPIRRKWKRSDFFFWKSYYLRVEDGIFRIDPVAFEILQENDRVIIRHLPRTGTVESLARVLEAPATDRGPAEVASAETPDAPPASAREGAAAERRRADVVLGEFFRSRPDEPDLPRGPEDEPR